MDSQNNSPEQEKEGEQQPSELPILSDNDDSQVTSDNAPPFVCDTISFKCSR
jgi:hypothetical protein